MITKNRVLTSNEIAHFQKSIYDYFAEHERSFVWRDTQDPYRIVVSEIMLQQTQTDRVIKKYDEFITQFPSIESLAQAPVSAVITAWQGLGYNRRALALKQLAERVVQEFQSAIPRDPEVLVTFRGIGPATAASICAFAFNSPTVFIETNIRSVFIHHFFAGRHNVHDNDIRPLIAQTLDFDYPRKWYYALMDYGVMLKKVHGNPSRKSAHHSQQSRFEGSDRQVRGAILKMLIAEQSVHEESFVAELKRDAQKIKSILSDLEKEGFIVVKKGVYSLVQSEEQPAPLVSR